MLLVLFVAGWLVAGICWEEWDRRRFDTGRWVSWQEWCPECRAMHPLGWACQREQA